MNEMYVRTLRRLLAKAIERGDRAAETMLRARIAEALRA